MPKACDSDLQAKCRLGRRCRIRFLPGDPPNELVDAFLFKTGTQVYPSTIGQEYR
ncbi:MAG TPA: hypothetical protein VMX36_13695 [Sedimentisphaerales bacterium]|nr:hypothetical protein [Sedimentisphaerales bacterium]